MTNDNARRHPALTALGRAAGSAMLLAAPALAQAQPNIKPPQAQAWIGVATYSGMGMPMGMGGGAAGNPIAALGSWTNAASASTCWSSGWKS